MRPSQLFVNLSDLRDFFETQEDGGSSLRVRCSQRCAADFLVGLIWANAFAYFYPTVAPIAEASVGTPLGVQHSDLGGTPPLVLAALALNGLVFTFLPEVLLKLRISPAILSRYTSSLSKGSLAHSHR